MNHTSPLALLAVLSCLLYTGLLMIYGRRANEIFLRIVTTMLRIVIIVTAWIVRAGCQMIVQILDRVL